MKIIRRVFLIVCVVGIANAQTSTSFPKNIILMIGDGMGVSQVTAGRTYKTRLELERFKHLGLLLTHAEGDHYVTESAGAATALSTGVKSYNAIAVHPNSSASETVLEKSQRNGKKTGIVTVCSITHATPAAFVAHVPSRSMQLEIAEQISMGLTDVILGSGWGWFLPSDKGGRRKDGRDLIRVLEKRGYTYVSTEAAFRDLDLQKVNKLIGLFAENHVGNAQTRRPSLSELTGTALNFLSNSPAGFFLMVEGSQIDWAGHDNNSDQVMIEMADFDDAIGEAVRFLERNPQTLIVVTADHETGGYSLNGGSLSDRTIQGKFTTSEHTAAMVPIFAMGPGAERFKGIIDNTDVGKLLLEFANAK